MTPRCIRSWQSTSNLQQRGTGMKAVRDLICFASLLAGVATSATAQQPSYQVSAASNGAVTIERDGKRAVYQPVFTIIRTEADPKLQLSGFASTPGESLENVNV